MPSGRWVADSLSARLGGEEPCSWTSAGSHGGDLCRQSFEIGKGYTCNSVGAACGSCSGLQDKHCLGNINPTSPNLCYEYNTTCCSVNNSCQNAINQQQQGVCNCTLNVGGSTAVGTKQLGAVNNGPGMGCPTGG